MEKKELIQKLINDYEQILNLVSKKLTELKDIASSNNIYVDYQQNNKPNASSVANVVDNDFVSKMEQQRAAMMQQMEGIRKNAQEQAQKAMSEAQAEIAKSKNSMPGTGSFQQMPGMGNMNMGGVPGMGSNPMITEMLKESKQASVQKQKEDKKDDK